MSVGGFHDQRVRASRQLGEMNAVAPLRGLHPVAADAFKLIGETDLAGSHVVESREVEGQFHVVRLEVDFAICCRSIVFCLVYLVGRKSGLHGCGSALTHLKTTFQKPFTLIVNHWNSRC